MNSPITQENKLMPSNTMAEFISVNNFREAVYAFSSRVFHREADAEFWPGMAVVLSTLDRAEVFSGWAGAEDMSASRRELGAFVSLSESGALEVLSLETAREYARLFLGVGPETISLCESSFTGATGGLYSNSFFEVQGEYRAAGAAKADRFCEPDDHLAVETAYMAWLTRKIIGQLISDDVAWYDLLGAQRRFLTNHLLNWVPELVRKLEKGTAKSFYAPAGRLLSCFLQLDLDLINYMIEAQPQSRRNSPAGQ